MWPGSEAGVQNVWIGGSWWGTRCDHRGGLLRGFAPPWTWASVACPWQVIDRSLPIRIWVFLDNGEEGGLQQAEAGWEQGPSARVPGVGCGHWVWSLLSAWEEASQCRIQKAYVVQPTGLTNNLDEDSRCKRLSFQILTEAAKCATPKYSFGIWITLSWNQSRPKRLRKTFVPLSLLKTVDRGPDPGGKCQSLERATVGARCVAGRSPAKSVKFLPVSRRIYLAQQTFIYQTFAFLSPCQLLFSLGIYIFVLYKQDVF